MNKRLTQILLFPFFGVIVTLLLIPNILFNSARWFFTGKGVFDTDPWFSDNKLSDLYE